jgi:hypothetical protein
MPRTNGSQNVRRYENKLMKAFSTYYLSRVALQAAKPELSWKLEVNRWVFVSNVESYEMHVCVNLTPQNNHPHVVFEAKSVGRQTCGNKRGFEWIMPSGSQGGSSDYARRGEDKGPQYFIELALLLDRPMVSSTLPINWLLFSMEVSPPLSNSSLPPTFITRISCYITETCHSVPLSISKTTTATTASSSSAWSSFLPSRVSNFRSFFSNNQPTFNPKMWPHKLTS